LNLDGTLALPPGGIEGSLDPSGFYMVSGPDEAPRFEAEENVAGQFVPGDENWDSRFTLRGVGAGLFANNSVYALAWDGMNLYVGGSFTAVGGVPANYIAKWDGASWSALGSGMNGPVRALAWDGANLYVGGSFTTAGGVQASRIAKWDGSAWGVLGTGMDNAVYALAWDGATLYAGGTFWQVGGTTANYIAKWNGSAWSTLGSGMNDNGYIYALAWDGTTLYAGGQFKTAGGVAARYIAKWDGSAWSPLGSGMNSHVYALAWDGTSLYAGGRFTAAGGAPANYIAEWDGNAWSSLDTGVDHYVHALAGDGAFIYAGGDFTTAGGLSAGRVARWDGSFWSALGSGVEGEVDALVLDGPDLYVGGGFAGAGGTAAFNVARWNGTGWSALPASGLGMNNNILALAWDSAGLYAGGDFTLAGALAAGHVARWNGSSWSPLGEGVNDAVHALTWEEGTLYAGGRFTTAGGAPANCIAKWDGSAWSPLGSGIYNDSSPFYEWPAEVNSLLSDGVSLYAGGVFTYAGAVVANCIAKWDGSAWSPLGSGINYQYYLRLVADVNALAWDGANLYAGGRFTSAGGVEAISIAKWDGIAWSPLGSGLFNDLGPPWNCPGDVYALAWDGANLYAGGSFVYAGGLPAGNIAKWDGSDWCALGSGMDAPVYALAWDGTNLYAAGEFTNAGGVAVSRIAKWDGSTWSALGSGTNDCVNALAWIGANLYAGGNFSAAGGLASGYIARWAGPAPTPDGWITLDKTIYCCSSVMNITLQDLDLTGAGTHDVEIFSTTEPTPETVTLIENSIGAVFQGTFPITGGPPVHGDNLLSVTSGDTITVRYMDADDGSGGTNVPKTDTAAANCLPPFISNVQVTSITPVSARITWTTDKAADSRVTYGTSVPPGTNQYSPIPYVTSHTMDLTGLTACTKYYFSVTSMDIYGNSATDTNGGAYHAFKTIGWAYALGPDDVEGGVGNWTAGGGGTSIWHRDTCRAHSGTYAWKAGVTDCPGTHGGNVDTYLTYGADLSLGAAGHGYYLRFWEFYDTASGYDVHCRPQISTDGGTTWTNLADYGGTGTTWTLRDCDLAAYSGNVRIRFWFHSGYSGGNFEGWYVDDIEISRSDITACPSPDGRITLDEPTYGCSSVMSIIMQDSDLTGTGMHDVEMFSTTEPMSETVTLTENPAGSGVFQGTFTTTGGLPVHGDSLLSVAEGDILSARYMDADDGSGGTDVPKTDTSVADCQPPVISNVQVTAITPTSARITWTTDEAANSRATWGTAVPPGTNEDDLTNYVTSHTMNLTGLADCTRYYFSVTSADIYGNSAADTNSGAYYTFKTLGYGYAMGPDDVEGGAGNWVASGGGTSMWHRDTCKAHSGIYAWKAGSTTCPGTYGNSVNVYLTYIEYIPLGAAGHGYHLRYWEYYQTQSSYDLCYTQISTNGGASWTTLNIYSGTGTGWAQRDFDLASYTGNVLIRFRFQTNASTVYEGWYVDDIEVNKGQACAASPPVNNTGANAAKFVKGSGDILEVTYDAATCRGDKVIVLYGNLGSWAGYAGCAQDHGGNTGFATLDSAGQNDVWYNLVWTQGTTAGHPGYAFNGTTDVARTWAVGSLCGITVDDFSHATCP
jgi:hypothetical protein